MAEYTVIGPVAVVRADNKSERYIYKGGVFSDEGADKASIKHLLAVNLIAKVKGQAAGAASDEGVYKDVSVADLKAKIAERNATRDDAAKITPAAPGNRPEIVAALLADDAASQS